MSCFSTALFGLRVGVWVVDVMLVSFVWVWVVFWGVVVGVGWVVWLVGAVFGVWVVGVCGLGNGVYSYLSCSGHVPDWRVGRVRETPLVALSC